VGQNIHPELYWQWTEVHGTFLPNAGGIAVDILVFPLWISLSIPETFAIEVWSWPKWRQIFDVICPAKV